MGESIIVNIRNINKKPVDPLYGNDYTYSVTKRGNEYQLAYTLES